jgi:hypothetical protein
MKLATMIRFINFRRDGQRWIIDLELEDGHTWMGWGVTRTKREAIQHIEAVVGQPVQFGSDRNVGWV